MTENSKDFYCSAGYKKHCGYENEDCTGCPNYHRKHPTPAQFEQEYRFKWEGGVYFLDGCLGWAFTSYKAWKMTITELAAEAGHNNFKLKADVYPCVCACTPFGCPGKDWRPE